MVIKLKIAFICLFATMSCRAMIKVATQSQPDVSGVVSPQDLHNFVGFLKLFDEEQSNKLARVMGEDPDKLVEFVSQSERLAVSIKQVVGSKRLNGSVIREAAQKLCASVECDKKVAAVRVDTVKEKQPSIDSDSECIFELEL